MKKDPKITLEDLSKDEQIVFLGTEILKLRDLLMVTLDQMNRLNCYRHILSDILEETGIATHKELDKLAKDFYKDSIKKAIKPTAKTYKDLDSLYKETGVLTVDELYKYIEMKYKTKLTGYDDIPEA